MKKLKMFAALLLTAVVAAATAMTAFADTADGSVTVTNAKKGETYDIYKVFDLTYSGKDETLTVAYTYNKTAEEDDLYTALTGSGLFTLTPTGTMTAGDKGVYNVTLKKTPVPDTDPVEYTTATGEEIGNWLKYHQADLGSAVNSKKATADGSLKFEGLSYGYYYITTTQGTLVTVDSTLKAVEVVDKTVAPTLEKSVQEGDSWGEKNDASFGDTVNYKLVIGAQPGARNYEVVDTLPAGFTLQADTVAVNDGNPLTPGADKDYVLTPAGDLHSFTLQFTEKYLDAYYNDQKGDSGEITITYSATVTSGAVVEGDGNVNKAVLKYGDAESTPEDTTTTYVWQFDVFKYTGTDTPLADAVFSVFTDAGCTEAKIMKLSQRSGKETYYFDKEGTVTEITTTATGKFTVEGLDSGTYYLKEISQPDGYMILTAPVTVEIKGVGEHELVLAEVENTPGQELPSTGGSGTVMFYVAGGLMMLAAAALVLKRRNA